MCLSVSCWLFIRIKRVKSGSLQFVSAKVPYFIQYFGRIRVNVDLTQPTILIAYLWSDLFSPLANKLGISVAISASVATLYSLHGNHQHIHRRSGRFHGFTLWENQRPVAANDIKSPHGTCSTNPTPLIGLLGAGSLFIFFILIRWEWLGGARCVSGNNKSAARSLSRRTAAAVNRIGGWRDSIQSNYIDLITNYANPWYKRGVIESIVDTLWQLFDTFMGPEALWLWRYMIANTKRKKKDKKGNRDDESVCPCGSFFFSIHRTNMFKKQRWSNNPGISDNGRRWPCPVSARQLLRLSGAFLFFLPPCATAAAEEPFLVGVEGRWVAEERGGSVWCIQQLVVPSPGWGVEGWEEEEEEEWRGRPSNRGNTGRRAYRATGTRPNGEMGTARLLTSLFGLKKKKSHPNPATVQVPSLKNNTPALRTNRESSACNSPVCFYLCCCCCFLTEQKSRSWLTVTALFPHRSLGCECVCACRHGGTMQHLWIAEQKNSGWDPIFFLFCYDPRMSLYQIRPLAVSGYGKSCLWMFTDSREDVSEGRIF